MAGSGLSPAARQESNPDRQSVLARGETEARRSLQWSWWQPQGPLCVPLLRLCGPDGPDAGQNSEAHQGQAVAPNHGPSGARWPSFSLLPGPLQGSLTAEKIIDIDFVINSLSMPSI